MSVPGKIYIIHENRGMTPDVSGTYIGEHELSSGTMKVFGLPGGGVGSYNVNDYTFTAQSGGRLKRSRSGKRSGKRVQSRRR